jgi:hypothetical protein
MLNDHLAQGAESDEGKVELLDEQMMIDENEQVEVTGRRISHRLQDRQKGSTSDRSTSRVNTDS